MMNVIDRSILKRHLGEGGKLLVAYSGGVDSHVLLHHFASNLPDSLRPFLEAIHVHHGLSANADVWVTHCKQQCEMLAIPLHIEHVEVSKNGSVEENARNARYQAFSKYVGEGDVLLQGHHANDQAETVLFRLERGAGTRGIQGIPVVREFNRGVIWRPLLEVSRQDIEQYAQYNNLKWVEDESNYTLAHRRNVLRHSVLQSWQAHNSNIAMAIASSATLIQKEMAVFDRLAHEALQEYLNSDGGLLLEKVVCPELEFWVSRFLRAHGVSLTAPQVMSVVKMFSSSSDKQPAYRGQDFRLARYADAIYVLPHTESPSTMVLEAGEWLHRKYDRLYSDHSLTVKARPEGETIKLSNGRHRPLKKWLQDQRIPAWWREQLPYLFDGTTLVAIADLWIDPNWHGTVMWYPNDKLPWPSTR
ncbi:tRNA lysidine(34) synthetase TilS [Marinomonas piezotolerans]|nr:tRNA lysidine(34) synthetase TilS [Marinomonas piezotolerans]